MFEHEPEDGGSLRRIRSTPSRAWRHRDRLIGIVAVCAAAALLGLPTAAGTAGAAVPRAVPSPSGAIGHVSAAMGESTGMAATAGAPRFVSQPQAATLTCTFDGSSNAVQGVTPGASIAVSCAGWSPNDTVFLAEVSPLFRVNGSQNEIDPNIQTVTTDAAGNLHATFVVPNPFKAPDPAAVCPPTASQQAAYGRCALALADTSGAGGAVGLVYSAAVPPAAPTAVGLAATPDGHGYWVAWSNGNVTVHGDAINYGNASTVPLVKPIAHIVATPSGNGYWLVAADGGTFAYGGAGFYGSMGGLQLNEPVVDMAPTPDGRGYWLVAADGGIFSFGDAVFHGSTGSLPLNQPVVGMAADVATGGYWLVASDGGIFAFDAPFYGSTGSLHLNKPVNGMAAAVTDHGYWFVASDGGIFAFGDAGFHGSTAQLTLAAPIVGMAADNATGGYWLVGADGGVFNGDAPFYGAG